MTSLKQAEIACGECGAPMRLRDSRFGPFYGCSKWPGCKGTHGAYPDGSPLGVPANAKTKQARQRAHDAFDRMWKTGRMSRGAAYRWVQQAMGLPKDAAHIGRFTIAECDHLLSLLPDASSWHTNGVALQRTLSIVKPDGVRMSKIGDCLSMLEGVELKIIAMKMVRLTREQAEMFYAVHKERPFFGALVDFMVSGPVVISVFEGHDAIMRNRHVMGDTNPEKQKPGTIRKKYATSIMDNVVHGSDSEANAKVEIAFFFPDLP